ncbi:MAG: phosphoadenosine phosphosulfate reductase family protein [Betaproteobacteria bacterium]
MLDDDGTRIESMMARGADVLEEARRYVENDLGTHIIGFVGAFSGGDDSIVATHFANLTTDDCVTFNANTMVGLKPTRDHIDRVIEKHKWAAEIVSATAEGPPSATETNAEVIANWRDGETAYEEFVLNHGFGGPSMHPRMYQRLKERQLMKLRRKLQAGKRGGRLIVISGIRHDESAIRAGYKRAWQDVPKQGVTWVNPFYDFTAADFELYRQEFGLTRNPVKRLCGVSGECCCGTFGSRCEREAYRKADAEFANYLDRLEEKVRERFPWGWGEGPPQWWIDAKRGQRFLCFDDEEPTFQPMCVGCNSGRR